MMARFTWPQLCNNKEVQPYPSNSRLLLSNATVLSQNKAKQNKAKQKGFATASKVYTYSERCGIYQIPPPLPYKQQVTLPLPLDAFYISLCSHATVLSASVCTVYISAQIYHHTSLLLWLSSSFSMMEIGAQKMKWLVQGPLGSLAEPVIKKK